MPASESTPLFQSAADHARSNLSTMTKLAEKILTKENLVAAGHVAKEKMQQLKSEAQDGNLSLRMIALCGGICLIVVSSLNIVGDVLFLNINAALIKLYTALVGVLMVILEGKIAPSYIERIHKFALFLKYLWGRGCLYFIVGTIQLSQRGLFNFIIGGFLCLLGAGFVVLGQRTALKLKEMRKSLYSEQELLSRFQAVDVDKDGLILLDEFRSLCLSLGLDMTRRETEAAFFHLAKSNTERLSYHEFQTWWNKNDTAVDENSFIFV